MPKHLPYLSTLTDSRVKMFLFCFSRSFRYFLAFSPLSFSERFFVLTSGVSMPNSLIVVLILILSLT